MNTETTSPCLPLPVPISSLLEIPRQQRMLLLPHCLRPAKDCPGVMSRQGLDCSACGRTECKIYPIRQAALEAGYGAICVAPGGRLAVRAVAEAHPQAIVAVACDRELADGVAAVNALGWNEATPPIVQIPLARDGCVETDVDLEEVLRVIWS